MRRLLFFCIIFIFGVTGTNASKQYDDLAKLVKSGTSEDVIIAYIDASDSSYNLSSDQVVQLRGYGASPHVIITAMKHKVAISTNSNTQPAPIETNPGKSSYPYQVAPALKPRWKVKNWYEQKMEKMNQALQLGVVGVMFGTFTLNYECLLGHEHGIVVEGNYFYNGDYSHGENAELAYRWHFLKRMNSGFLGVFIKGDRSNGSENDVPGVTVGYTQTSITIGPNIGYRWVSPWGLSLVGRFGYGYNAWSKFSNAVPDKPTIDLLQRRSALDSELSLGYAF